MSGSQWWVGGAGQQAYSTAANWSATRGGAGGNGPPIAGDDVHIVDGNSQIIGSDQSAIALASFELNFSPQGTQSVPPLSIGTSSAAPLKIGLAAGASAVLNGQHGDIYIGASFADANGMLVCNGTGNVFVCGVASAGGGSIVGGVNAGKVTVNSDYAGTIQLLNLGTTMEVAASSTSTTLSVTVDRGRVTTFRSITTGEVSGTLITGGTAAITSLVTVRKNGLHNHRSTGTITAETVKGGGTANSIGAPSGFTITNSTVYGDASFFVGSTNITYTNPTKRVGILLETPDYLP
jgi:hypothetical protein